MRALPLALTSLAMAVTVNSRPLETKKILASLFCNSVGIVGVNSAFETMSISQRKAEKNEQKHFFFERPFFAIFFFSKPDYNFSTTLF